MDCMVVGLVCFAVGFAVAVFLAVVFRWGD
jgi:hypothetical protein